jgi:hypothetical protein
LFFLFASLFFHSIDLRLEIVWHGKYMSLKTLPKENSLPSSAMQ